MISIERCNKMAPTRLNQNGQNKLPQTPTVCRYRHQIEPEDTRSLNRLAGPCTTTSNCSSIDDQHWTVQQNGPQFISIRIVRRPEKQTYPEHCCVSSKLTFKQPCRIDNCFTRWLPIAKRPLITLVHMLNVQQHNKMASIYLNEDAKNNRMKSPPQTPAASHQWRVNETDDSHFQVKLCNTY